MESIFEILQKKKDSFSYKIVFNKTFKLLFWFCCHGSMLLFLVLAIIFISLNSKALNIVGFIFLVFAIVMIIIACFLIYFEKMSKNAIKSDFTLYSILSRSLVDNNIIKNQLNIDYSDKNVLINAINLSSNYSTYDTFFVSWLYNGSTFNNNDIKFLYIAFNSYNDKHFILINKKRHFLLNIAINKIIDNEIIITNNRDFLIDNENYIIEEFDNLICLSKNRIDKNIINYLNELTKLLNENSLKYKITFKDNIVILTLFFDRNFLFVNLFDNNYSTSRMKEDLKITLKITQIFLECFNKEWKRI